MIDEAMPPLLHALLEFSNDALIVTDEQNRIVLVNAEFERLTGYTRSELIGEHPKILGADPRNDGLLAAVRDALRSEGTWKGEVWGNGKNGESSRYTLFIRAVAGENGAAGNCIALLRLSEDGGREEGSNHDPLTGLPNRHLFQDRIGQALINARRTGKSIAVLLIAVDRFTLINQGFGHSFGDRVLKETAGKLLNCIRESDTVARLEGDHFILVMPVNMPDDIVIIAEKVLHSINEPLELDGQDVVITSSIGIGVFPEDGKNAEELIRHADSAMRYAKKQGGNQYQFFSNQMNARAKKRLEMETRIRQAIQKEEFVLYYQPKVNVESNHIEGAEALIRWNHPERGLVSPTEFIPIAEETGLIGEIGFWALKEACRQNRAWQDKGLKSIRVSVNVSGRQFKDRHFADRVESVLGKTGLNPRCLELELTESMLMDDVGQIVEKLGQIRKLGVYISIDDFGTGYSNLSYLHSFPITTLKIDRAFVKDIETNANIAEISRTIINLSKGLKLEVVAEGAETKEHVAFLREHGCGMIQGYFYSKPLSVGEFESLLARGIL